MNTLVQSQVFFFISSVGFIILSILIAVFLYYLINAVKIFHRIMGKLEKDIENIGDTTTEILEDLRDSSLFRFFIKNSKRKRKAREE